MNNTFAEIAGHLKRAHNIAIACHVRPDGDALGSGLALCLALENAGKNVNMVCEDKPVEKFSFLPATSKVSQVLPNIDYDVFISVDCADLIRLGIFSKSFKNFRKTTINIDHHISNNGYAKLNYVKPCPATCEIMTEFFMFAGYEITEEIANLLMLGIMTDSGNFTHQDVNESTLKAAAYLLSKGANTYAINYNMFVKQSQTRAVLYAKVMNKMRFALSDKFAFAIITQSDLAACGANADLTEGFVDFPLSIDGVEVSASIMECKKNQYKISLRSKGTANVNAVAMKFGGGGHILASGCMIFGELEEVIERLTYAVYVNL